MLSSATVPTCGIDFGTSNSLAALAGPAGVSVCDVDLESLDPQVLPSLLYFSRYGWHAIGRAATHAYQQDPDGRFIRALKSALPDYGPEETFRIWRKPYHLPDLLAMVLGRIKQRVDAEAGQPVTHVTMGRPVRFSANVDVDQRAEEMLRSAAEAVGFQEIRFLSEPEAATRHYFSGTRGAPDSTIMVFDFGGGTLDLCAARFGSDGYRVLNTAGVHIGGTLLDRVLFEKKLTKHLGQGQTWGRGLPMPYHIFNRLINPEATWRITDVEYAREVREILNTSIAWNNASPQLKTFAAVAAKRLGPDLFDAIEAAKIRLSSEEETEIRFSAGDVKIVEPLSREDLRVLFREQLDAIRTLILETLAAVQLTPKDVDQVLLAGGSSALICIQELLGDLFGEERVPLRQDLFTSIVRGLALDAASRN